MNVFYALVKISLRLSNILKLRREAIFLFKPVVSNIQSLCAMGKWFKIHKEALECIRKQSCFIQGNLQWKLKLSILAKKDPKTDILCVITAKAFSLSYFCIFFFNMSVLSREGVPEFHTSFFYAYFWLKRFGCNVFHVCQDFSKRLASKVL